MMYGFLALAAGLFSLQFLFQQQFGKRRGEGLTASLAFLACSNSVGFLLLWTINGFVLRFSWVAAGLALVQAAVMLGYIYASLKAMETGDLAMFSLFAMVGGMLLPAVCGFCLGEKITWAWALCAGAIVLAVFLATQGGMEKKNLKWYAAVFLLNGLVGVVAKLHQSSPGAVDSGSFLMLVMLWSVGVCALWHWAREGALPRFDAPQALLAGGYALCNALGNLLCLVALTVLPASVQYPMVTGGVMVCSAVVGRVQGEKIPARKALALLLAVLATVILAL